MITPSLSARIEQLIKAWREAAIWEHEEMWNVQSAKALDQCANELESALAQGVQPVSGSPIQLSPSQEEAVKTWAADDRLWTTQETVEFNLRTFARVILKESPRRHRRVKGRLA